MVIVALLRIRTHGIIDIQCVARTWRPGREFSSLMMMDDDGFIGLRLFLVLKCLASDFQ